MMNQLVFFCFFVSKCYTYDKIEFDGKDIVINTFVVCQMLIAIILSNLEEAQKQYNALIKDKLKRKKQLVCCFQR
jgi:hypothetical protein